MVKSSALIILAAGIATAMAENWVLTWADEFNGGSIDRSKWNFEIGNGGWGNNELEYYTDRSENARVENGNLIISANRDWYNGNEYSSARMKT